MDPDSKRTKSVHKSTNNSIQAQQGLQRTIFDNLGTHQQETINSKMQTNKVLFSKRSKEFPCDKSQHAVADSLENRFLKVRQSLLQSQNGDVDRDFGEQAIESLQRILAQTDLLKKEEATMSIPKPKYEENLKLQKHFQMDHNSKALHLPFTYMVRSNATGAFECPSNANVIFKEKSKVRERSRTDKSLSLNVKHLDFFEVVKEQLQQKDLENQHLIHLLLVKQQELRETKELLKQKETETQVISEKLKYEEQRNTEITTRFDQTCADMRTELSTAKNNNRDRVKQLKALMKKYEQLKTRTNTMKDQLNMELTEKKSSQKTMKKLKQMAQELLTKQKLLEEERDKAARELSLCKETLQLTSAEHKKHLNINQRLEEELSAMRTESASLRDHLCKAQEKNKELIQLARSKESDKERNVKESQDMIEKLNAELERCREDKEKMNQQVEAMKNESKLIENKQRVEMLQLQEQRKASLQQCDGLRRECETLMEMVNKLKKERHILTEKLETIYKEKMTAEMVSTKEGERLKEAIRLLEREREVLLAEMEDLRKDYLGLSDRITQKMGYLDPSDPPMTITDITSIHRKKAQKKDFVQLLPTDDVIQEIRRKLEEENIQQK